MSESESSQPAATSPAPETPESPQVSLEELQRQLAEMEETESMLASRLEQQTNAVEPQLDSHLAVIEEQFRKNFDDRLRSTTAPTVLRRGAGGGADSVGALETDVLLVNRVFRDVSRLMGDEWKPVFDRLVAQFPTDVVAAEKDALERQPTLIQGYRSLLAWKEMSGQDFDIRQLIDALKTCNMEDVAEAATALLECREVSKDDKAKQSKPVQRRKSDVTSRGKTATLDNRRMLLLAKKVGGDWESLGKALGVAEEELTEIKESADGATYQGAFKMLWAWRQAQPAGDDEGSSAALKEALQQVNKAQLAEQLVA